MESTIDLILKGHFESLKEKANVDNNQDDQEIYNLLLDIENYLKNRDDEEAKGLLNRLNKLNQQNLPFKKKPMQKAGSKTKKNTSQKAG